MKTIISFIIAIVFTQFAVAQSSIITIDYNKMPTTAITNNYSNAKGIVDAAIANRFKGKTKKKNGYVIYEGVNLPEISATPVDLYFKTAQTGKKNNLRTNVTMLISSGNEVFYSNDTDADIINSASSLLENLKSDISNQQLKTDINAQSAQVKAAEKNLNKKENELKNLQKQKKDIENKISKVEKEINDAQKTLQSEKEKQHMLEEQ